MGAAVGRRKAWAGWLVKALGLPSAVRTVAFQASEFPLSVAPWVEVLMAQSPEDWVVASKAAVDQAQAGPDLHLEESVGARPDEAQVVGATPVEAV